MINPYLKFRIQNLLNEEYEKMSESEEEKSESEDLTDIDIIEDIRNVTDWIVQNYKVPEINFKNSNNEILLSTNVIVRQVPQILFEKSQSFDSF